MAQVWLASTAVLTLLVVVLLFNRYGNWRKLPWIVTFITGLGWYLSFAIVMMVRRCAEEHGDNCPKGTQLAGTELLIMWDIMYWLCFFFTWAVIPILQSYVMAGEFEFGPKLRRSFWENVIFYLIIGVVLLVPVIYITVKRRLTGPELMAMSIALSNAWGLLLLIGLLGHGLVEIPRHCYIAANRPMRLRYFQFQAALLHEKLEDARADLYGTLREVETMLKQVPVDHEYRKYVHVILTKCPEDFRTLHQDDQPRPTEDVPSYSKLASVHKHVMDHIAAVDRQKELYIQLCHAVYELEDEIDNMDEPSRTFQSSLRPPRIGKVGKLMDKMEWYMRCWLKPIGFILLLFICAAGTIIAVWSECTMFSSDPDLSVWSLLVHQKKPTEAGIQFWTFLPLAYMSVAAYSSLFKLQIFNYYRLVPHKHSDGNSLLFSAAYSCRMAAPLCYNMLNLLHETDGLAFSKIMGKVDLVPVFGRAFNVYFPIILLLLCIMTLFNVYTRLANCLGMSKFLFEDQFDDKQIKEGVELLAQERERLAKARQSGDRLELLTGSRKRNVDKENWRRMLDEKNSHGGSDEAASEAGQRELTDMQPVKDVARDRNTLTTFDNRKDTATSKSAAASKGGKGATPAAAGAATSTAGSATARRTTGAPPPETLEKESRTLEDPRKGPSFARDHRPAWAQPKDQPAPVAGSAILVADNQAGGVRENPRRGAGLSRGNDEDDLLSSRSGGKKKGGLTRFDDFK